jgi:hypothetical protein
MAQQMQHEHKMVKQSKEIRKKVEMFIQNFDAGLLLLDPYDMKIKFNNADNTQTRTLSDWTLQAISDYEENKNDKLVGDKLAKTCLDWIRIGYANNVIKEGTSLLRRFEELTIQYNVLKEEHRMLQNSYTDLGNKHRSLKQRKDNEIQKRLC